MLGRLLAIVNGRHRIFSPTGKFCNNCGSPMVAEKDVALRYDEDTGMPIKGDGRSRCSRDQFCGLRGLPGF